MISIPRVVAAPPPLLVLIVWSPLVPSIVWSPMVPSIEWSPLIGCVPVVFGDSNVLFVARVGAALLKVLRSLPIFP
jgi:hypothetical protein